MFRRSRPGDAPPDPMEALGSRWRYPMRRIGDVVARLRTLEETGPDGPSALQLERLTEQAGTAWDTAWQVATEATRCEGSLATVDPGRIASDLEDARRRLADVPDGSPDSVRAAAEVNTRESQFRAVHEVWNLVDDADAQLRLMASALEDAASKVTGLGVPTAAEIELAIEALTSVNRGLAELRDHVTQVDDTVS